MRWVAALAMVLAVGCATTTVTPSPASPAPTSVSSPSPTATATPVSTAPTPDIAPAQTVPPAADVASQLREPGILTACLSVVGAPATGLDEQGLLVGYNVSFAVEIAERLGLELATREPLFDTLIDVVRDHQCDIVVSSQNLTSSRLGLVDFVVYTESVQPVIVATGNPSNISGLADLCGQRVSATEGTTHVDLVNGTGDYRRQGLNDACVAVGEPTIDLRIFETESHAATALLDGQVDAYLGNSGFQAEFPEQLEFSQATLPPARQGITTALDRPILNTAVQATMAQMFGDGTYREILVQHLANEESVQLVSILE